MSTTKRKTNHDTFRVTDPMDESGRMTVRPMSRFVEYEIVGYVDDPTRRRLAALSEGEHARLELAPVPDTENAYEVSRYVPGSLTGV